MGTDREGNTAGFPSDAFVFGYCIPTMCFHIVTAYGILRKEGVPLTMDDYIKSFGERYD